MYVCICNRVTDREFCAHLDGEELTVSMVYRALGIKAKCGKCVPSVLKLLRQSGEGQRPCCPTPAVS
jgi:bacterioferritin-associated ferredoxin